MNTSTTFAVNTSKTHHIHIWTESEAPRIEVIADQIRRGEFDNTHILYWAAEEWGYSGSIDYNSIPQFRDNLIKHNTWITFVFGCQRTVYHADTFDPIDYMHQDTDYDQPEAPALDYYCSNVRVLNFPDMFMWMTANNYLHKIRRPEGNDWVKSMAIAHNEAQPTKLWTTMIGEVWLHRRIALDELALKGCMDYGSVIINNVKIPMPKFNCWNKQNLIRTVLDNEPIDQYDAWPQEYTDSVIDIVMESSAKYRFVTEKTWRPVFYGKPFVILGARNANSALGEKFGLSTAGIEFETKWDQYRTYEDRAKGCADWLAKLHLMYGNNLHDLRMKLNYTCNSNKGGLNIHIKNANTPEIMQQFPDQPAHLCYEYSDSQGATHHFQGYQGFVKYVEKQYWDTKQQIADRIRQETGNPVNSEDVPWLH